MKMLLHKKQFYDLFNLRFSESIWISPFSQLYAHLAPDHLHDAVASIKFSAHFQHTTNSEQKEASENGLKAVENGGRGWI